jgi:hypothetical protein
MALYQVRGGGQPSAACVQAALLLHRWYPCKCPSQPRCLAGSRQPAGSQKLQQSTRGCSASAPTPSGRGAGPQASGCVAPACLRRGSREPSVEVSKKEAGKEVWRSARERVAAAERLCHMVWGRRQAAWSPCRLMNTWGWNPWQLAPPTAHL